MAVPNDLILDVRSFNRFYTHILGLLDRHILDSDFSLTEARLLYEIDKAEQCSVNILSDRLQIDRSYMSRMIKRFEKNGFLKKQVSRSDNRIYYLILTDKGRNILNALTLRSNEQVRRLLKPLTSKENEEIRYAMHTIQKYFSHTSGAITIRDFTKNDIPYIVSRQVEMYKKESKLSSPVFGEYVTKGVHELADGLDKEKECIFVLDYNHIPSGCIAIKNDDEKTAQLRYFFLEPEIRGLGAGNKLIDTALNFCKEKNYERVFLLTISAQEVARKLYEKKGFICTEQYPRNDWGTEATEERWELILT